MTEQVYILSGVRTAIGTFGGSLSKETPAGLGAAVAAEAIRRAGVQPADVGHVVFGNVIPNGAEDAYLGRVCAINAGMPKETPAMTLNRRSPRSSRSSRRTAWSPRATRPASMTARPPWFWPRKAA